jgi:general secretion pathway protein I
LCVVRYNHKGFTLLEIVITVAIFAAASTALLKSSAQAVFQTQGVQDRTIGFWLAENELERLRSAPRTEEYFPAIGTDRENVTMANRDWELKIQVESTENPDMRRVIVTVFAEQDLDVNVASLVGFIGKN